MKKLKALPTIPEYLSHLIPPSFEWKHSKFIRSQNKQTPGGGEFIYHISRSNGIGVSVVLENVKTHDTLDLSDYASW